MSTDVKLGTVPTEDSERDAIHIAVAPAIAAVDMNPGQCVKVIEGEARPVHSGGTGIIDPFLGKPVSKGNRVWVLLYQNTIVGMRHHWSHPDFSDLPPNESRAPTSEAWLRRFADEHFSGDYRYMMDSAKGGSLCFDTTSYPKEDNNVFWAHYNAVANASIQDGYFRCGC
jgi:hypothetical protein